MSTFVYSVTGARVATWQPASEQYGTSAALNVLQSVEIDPEHATDEVRNLGAVERMLSVMEKANLTLEMGGLEWAGLAKMTSMANTTSGSGSGAVTTNEYAGGGAGLPYFGLIVQLEADDGGVIHAYLRWCKLSTYPPVSANMNEFANPSIDAVAGRLRLAAGTTFNIVTFKEYEQPTSIPTDFNTALGIS